MSVPENLVIFVEPELLLLLQISDAALDITEKVSVDNGHLPINILKVLVSQQCSASGESYFQTHRHQLEK